MDILWNPEYGTCSHCCEKSDSVRRFTMDKYHTVFCFSCWKKAQFENNDLCMSKKEWLNQNAILFEYNDHFPGNEHPSQINIGIN